MLTQTFMRMTSRPWTI